MSDYSPDLAAEVDESDTGTRVIDNLNAPVSDMKMLLRLLQDNPIPAVQDPLNVQSGLSIGVETSGGDVQMPPSDTATAGVTYSAATTTSSSKYGVEINPNTSLTRIEATTHPDSDGYTTLYVLDASGSVIKSTAIAATGGDTVGLDVALSTDTTYYVVVDAGGNNYTSVYGADSTSSTSSTVDITGGYAGGSNDTPYLFTSVTGISEVTAGYATDRFTAPTTEPAAYSAWNAVRAVGVDTGGSTSATPVEFDILDSADTTLNSSRIPRSEIADSAFKLRSRAYSATAGADGQADYQIPETGAGGHYGLPIQAVVAVEHNGSVLASDAWEFDGNSTVSIDTSTVDIVAGDTVTISYDIGVFDSTLQLRAHLSREAASEASPSISAARYEYVV